MSLRCPGEASRPAEGMIRLMVAATLVLALAGCERETRRFRDIPPTETADAAVPGTTLAPGPSSRPVSYRNAVEGNAWGVSEGKRLFKQYNCSGCHGQGGGAIGPALMDDAWIYGSDAAQIYASIVEGRPNGMPAFGGKLPSAQVWQIVGYVRSLSGWVRKDVAPARDDAMQVKSQEQATDEQPERPPAGPPGTEHP